MKNKNVALLVVLPLLFTSCAKTEPQVDNRGKVEESSDGLSLVVTDMQNRSFTIR